jgi:hypothetical protein
MAQARVIPMTTDETAQAADIVQRFLVASMVPDPQTAALYIAGDLKITFTGAQIRPRAKPRPSMPSATNG